MKVVGIVSAHFLPHLGGVERYTYNLAKELLRNGRKVMVITSAYEQFPEKESLDGIIVYRLPAFQCMNGRMPIVKKNKKFERLVREIQEKYKIEKLIINTHLYTLSCWGARWGKKNVEKIVLIGHGTAHMNFNNVLVNNLARVYEHMLMWYIKKYVTEYYGVSLACNEWLKHFSIRAQGVFYNAINPDDFYRNELHYRKDLSIAQDVIMISFVGRVLEDKGIRKLCEAFEKLKKEKTCLVVAGDGELFSELKERYEDVTWLGAISHDKVIDLLNETDIYVLPTDYPEGFPTGVLEAAMCGCCIVTTKAGGSKELIIDDSYGIIMEENTIEQLAKTLEYLTRHRELIESSGRNVKGRVQQNFTWEATVKRMIKELDKDEE